VLLPYLVAALGVMGVVVVFARVIFPLRAIKRRTEKSGGT